MDSNVEMNLDKFLTLEQVAKLLKVSRRVIYRLINEKRLIAIHVGRSLRISKVDLESYLENAHNSSL